jgi:hypothetical protein
LRTLRAASRCPFVCKRGFWLHLCTKRDVVSAAVVTRKVYTPRTRGRGHPSYLTCHRSNWQSESFNLAWFDICLFSIGVGVGEGACTILRVHDWQVSPPPKKLPAAALWATHQAASTVHDPVSEGLGVLNLNPQP